MSLHPNSAPLQGIDDGMLAPLEAKGIIPPLQMVKLREVVQMVHRLLTRGQHTTAAANLAMSGPTIKVRKAAREISFCTGIFIQVEAGCQFSPRLKKLAPPPAARFNSFRV